VLLSLGEKDFHLFEVFSLEVDLSRHREDFEGYGLVADKDKHRLFILLPLFENQTPFPPFEMATDCITVSKIC
tara:strand:- start:1820 stop:2038 length:219 start_codon:yes stop_codon:yes gene_type:complete